MESHHAWCELSLPAILIYVNLKDSDLGKFKRLFFGEWKCHLLSCILKLYKAHKSFRVTTIHDGNFHWNFTNASQLSIPKHQSLFSLSRKRQHWDSVFPCLTENVPLGTFTVLLLWDHSHSYSCVYCLKVLLCLCFSSFVVVYDWSLRQDMVSSLGLKAFSVICSKSSS